MRQTKLFRPTLNTSMTKNMYDRWKITNSIYDKTNHKSQEKSHRRNLPTFFSCSFRDRDANSRYEGIDHNS